MAPTKRSSQAPDIGVVVLAGRRVLEPHDRGASFPGAEQQQGRVKQGRRTLVNARVSDSGTNLLDVGEAATNGVPPGDPALDLGQSARHAGELLVRPGETFTSRLPAWKLVSFVQASTSWAGYRAAGTPGRSRTLA